jgi:hypothetical protein
MADLGFLPVRAPPARRHPARRASGCSSRRRSMPPIGVLVKRYLSNPVTHEADSAQSPVAEMAHHVLHVTAHGHLPGARRPRRRAGPHGGLHPHQAPRQEARPPAQRQGVPAVELHGNLSQNARTRTMEAFHSGAARTLVATDIAARGIHVDDVALVIHADPPVEHKAYLHRSGRTARAGNAGTVVTLMTDDQVRDVRDLTRKAGVNGHDDQACGHGHPLLQELAPGERSYAGGFTPAVVAAPAGGSRGSGRGGSGRSSSERSGAPRGGAARQPAAAARAGSSPARAASSPARSASAPARTGAAPARRGGAAAFSASSRAGSGRGGRSR